MDQKRFLGERKVKVWHGTFCHAAGGLNVSTKEREWYEVATFQMSFENK